jgi:imidazolonepropionase-like amidohydrolase
MTNKIQILLILISLVFINKANCQFQFDTYAIHGVNVIDVKNRGIVENQTIVIENDIIKGVFDSKNYNNPDSIQVLDFSGYYIAPGLIDAHVHLASNPSQDDNFEVTKDRLNYLLKNGITSVRDMAGDARFLSYLSRQAFLGEIPSPDIYFSALIAGESFFKDPRTKLAAQGAQAGKAPWMRGINANSNLSQIIAEAKGTGATGVKVYADLDKFHVQKVVQEAHYQGLKVWAHSTVFPARPSEVSQAGVDVMSHATYLAWEGENEIPTDASLRHRKHDQFQIDNPVFLALIEKMKSNRTILDPTISVYKRYFPDSTLYQYGTLLTKLAYANNVSIGVGTDLPIDVTAAAPIFQEMTSLQEDAGMEPIDIIRGATIVNAEMIGKENEIGSIEIGKRANLIILKNNPLKNINNIKSIHLVIKNGRLFNTN